MSGNIGVVHGVRPEPLYWFALLKRGKTLSEHKYLVAHCLLITSLIGGQCPASHIRRRPKNVRPIIVSHRGITEPGFSNIRNGKYVVSCRLIDHKRIRICFGSQSAIVTPGRCRLSPTARGPIWAGIAAEDGTLVSDEHRLSTRRTCQLTMISVLIPFTSAYLTYTISSHDSHPEFAYAFIPMVG